MVVDNAYAGTSLTGSRGISTLGPKWGSNFRHSDAGAGANTFTWTPAVPDFGDTAFNNAVPFAFADIGGQSPFRQ